MVFGLGKKKQDAGPGADVTGSHGDAEPARAVRRRCPGAANGADMPAPGTAQVAATGQLTQFLGRSRARRPCRYRAFSQGTAQAGA